MAKIEKIFEDTLFKNGSKAQVLPITIDKAVGTKSIHKAKDPTIVALDDVLSRLWYRGWCYGVWADNNKDAKKYYMFAFSNKANYTDFIKYITASTKEFKSMILDDYIDESDIELANALTESLVYTEDVLLQRLEFKTVSALLTQYFLLHSSIIPSIVLEDENGNKYNNGDTIYFNQYPGKLKVLLQLEDKGDVIDTIESIILGMPEGNYKGYGFQIEGRRTNLSDENEKEMLFTEDLETVRPHRPYHTAEKVEQITIGNIADLIDRFLHEGFWFYIFPSDYPQNSSELEEYCSHVRKGNVEVTECILNTDFSVDTYLGNVAPMHAYVVFNPTSEFVFETNNTEESIMLTSGNNYVSTVVIKGKFPEEESTVTIGFGEETDFEISLDGETYVDGYTTNLELTPEQIEEGVLVYIRPSNWENTENYAPYDSPVVNNVTLYCSYNGTEISKELTVNITYEVTAEDLHEDQMSVASDITPVEDNSERLGEIQLSLGNTIKALTFEKAEGYVFELALSQGSNGIVWNTFPSSITNIVVAYSTTIENGEYVNHSIINPGDVISAEELLANNGVSIKLYVPVNDQNNHFIKGKGGIKVYLRDADGPYMYKVPITLIPDSMSSADLSDFTQWQQIAGLTESPQP